MRLALEFNCKRTIFTIKFFCVNVQFSTHFKTVVYFAGGI